MDDPDEYVACEECGKVCHWLNIVTFGLSDLCIECFEESDGNDDGEDDGP